MRVIKGLVLLCFSVVAITGCFNPPEFSDIPKLTYKDIKFKEGPVANDSLILFLDFQDGDGNFGLSPADTDPELLYFLQNGSGDSIPVTSFFRTEPRPNNPNQTITYTIINTGGFTGKLITTETRSLPNYGWLPAYNPNNFYNYIEIPNLLVPLTAVDATYEIADTITLSQSATPFALVTNIIYYKHNPYFSNIEVKFWQLQGVDYVEYDLFEHLGISFNARIPTSTSANPVYKDRPLEGSIRYNMSSNFNAIFGNNRLKVSARIRDRAGNYSKTVFSKEFTLAEIK